MASSILTAMFVLEMTQRKYGVPVGREMLKKFHGSWWTTATLKKETPPTTTSVHLNNPTVCSALIYTKFPWNSKRWKTEFFNVVVALEISQELGQSNKKDGKKSLEMFFHERASQQLPLFTQYHYKVSLFSSLHQLAFWALHIEIRWFVHQKVSSDCCNCNCTAHMLLLVYILRQLLLYNNNWCIPRLQKIVLTLVRARRDDGRER